MVLLKWCLNTGCFKKFDTILHPNNFANFCLKQYEILLECPDEIYIFTFQKSPEEGVASKPKFLQHSLECYTETITNETLQTATRNYGLFWTVHNFFGKFYLLFFLTLTFDQILLLCTRNLLP